MWEPFDGASELSLDVCCLLNKFIVSEIRSLVCWPRRVRCFRTVSGASHHVTHSTASGVMTTSGV